LLPTSGSHSEEECIVQTRWKFSWIIDGIWAYCRITNVFMMHLGHQQIVHLFLDNTGWQVILNLGAMNNIISFDEVCLGRIC